MQELKRIFSPEVMAELARPMAPFGTRSAELAEGVTPAWYVIETYSRCERKVMEELVSRCFGVFVPEIEETVVRRGRQFESKSLMFTSYIFVFLWLTDRNYSLIVNTEGVMGFVTVNDGKPARIGDNEINILRRVENGKRPFPLIEIDTGIDQVPPAKLSKRARRRWKPKPTFIDPVKDTILVRSWSAFDDGFAGLDSQQRNQTLLQALSLSS